MTDYSKLSNNELMLTIGKAKGWTKVSSKFFGYPPDTTTPAEEQIDPNWVGRFNGTRKLPAYPTDIAAARELLEEMLYYQVKHVEKNKYKVWLYPSVHLLDGKVAESDTLERAICLCWLAWNESEVK